MILSDIVFALNKMQAQRGKECVIVVEGKEYNISCIRVRDTKILLVSEDK